MASAGPNTNSLTSGELLLEAVINSQHPLTAEEADIILQGPQSPIALLTPTKAQSSSSSSSAAAEPVITVPETPTVIRKGIREAKEDEIPKMELPPHQDVVDMTDEKDEEIDPKTGSYPPKPTKKRRLPYLTINVKHVKDDGEIVTRTQSVQHPDQLKNAEEYIKTLFNDLGNTVVCHKVRALIVNIHRNEN